MSPTLQTPITVRRLVPMAFVIGLGAGVGAWLLKWLCSQLGHIAHIGAKADGLNWQFLVWPLVGVVLTSLAAKYLFRQNVENACDKLRAKLRSKDFSMSPNVIWETIGGCAMTVGLGASAGTESPIAYAGAAMGGTVGRICSVDGKLMKILVACGAGAGIAAIFRAPMGGFFFTLEILQMELTTVPILALGLSCLTASLTTYVLAGRAPDIVYLSPVSPDTSAYLPLVIIAIIIGAYSLWYTWTSKRTLSRLNKFSPWVKTLSSGLILGLAVLLMPALYGDGYSLMTGLLAANPAGLLSQGIFGADITSLTLIITAVGMLAVKGMLVALANNGGGVAGDFSPTLFVGCILGWLAAYVCNTWLGLSLPLGTFACIGMAAAMAAILQAPLMSIFITVEATQAYSLLLPVTLAAMIGYLTPRTIKFISVKVSA